MLTVHIVRQIRAGVLATFGVAALAFAAACGSDSDTTGVITPTDAPKTFNQVQRLGNPLVSEVLLLKRDHGFHGSSNPSEDVANFTAPVKGFVAQFRPAATGLQNALAGTLLPDMLQVQTDQPQSTAGYLSYVLSGTGKGFGGRKLADDVVDISLTAVFSDLLDPTQAVCKPFTLPLCTDNVPSHGGFTPAFPYLAQAK
ncbi:hypothetical protein BH11GEM1_BH11GEM1_06510 [soil metagenome]